MANTNCYGRLSSTLKAEASDANVALLSVAQATTFCALGRLGSKKSSNDTVAAGDPARRGSVTQIINKAQRWTQAYGGKRDTTACPQEPSNKALPLFRAIPTESPQYTIITPPIGSLRTPPDRAHHKTFRNISEGGSSGPPWSQEDTVLLLPGVDTYFHAGSATHRAEL